MTVMNGAYPSPRNYMGFPKSLCTSVNEVREEIIEGREGGIPNPRTNHPAVGMVLV